MSLRKWQHKEKKLFINERDNCGESENPISNHA